jgi:NitT/TauT family transport system substrate-binding protein
MHRLLAAALALAVLTLAGTPARAEVSELRITKQPGLAFLPLIIAEQQKLIEKQARARGLDLKVSWVTLGSGGAAVDALLAGNVDFVSSGLSNALVAWSASGGQIKGITPLASTPIVLVTNNPNVKSLKDFTPADKIAVPTVKVSMQAVLLQMAAEQQLGDPHKLDSITVALSHPDAYIALKNNSGTVNSHFSNIPYEQLELKIPGVHEVISADQITGGSFTSATTFGTVKFHDANPKTIAAFHAALAEAMDYIKNNRRAAAQIYLQESGEKWTLDEMVAILGDKSMFYTNTPRNTYKIADIMYRAGDIKMKAASWKDYYFPEITALPGS